VSYDRRLSPICSVPFRVLQGSVLGTLLFVLYTVNLSQDMLLLQYGDNCQVCVMMLVDDAVSAGDHLARCIVDVNA